MYFNSKKESEGELKLQGKTIKKRLDGRWWVRYYENGVQKSIYGRTQKECYNKLKFVLRGLEKKPAINHTTLETWMHEWYELYKLPNLKPSSLKNITTGLKHLPPELIKKDITKITTNEIQKFLLTLESMKRTQSKLRTYLFDIFDKAKKNRLIRDNPIENVIIKKYQQPERRALTLQEEQRLRQRIKGTRYEYFYLFLLYTGLRKGELHALTWEDIDFVEKRIRINKNLQSNGEIGTPKTAKSIRVIPLSKHLEEEVLKNLTISQGRIFPQDEKTIYQEFIRIREEIGLEDITLHSLRHTFATRCLEAGIPAKQVQVWLGHSSLDMTMNVYTHVQADFERQNVAKFDTYFDTYSDT